jgi:two-component system nitrogen regulation sensor histidine kinase GlnL
MNQQGFAAFEYLATGVVVVDVEGHIQHLNAAAEDLLGLSRRSVIGAPLARFFTDPVVFEQAIEGAGRAEFSALRYDAYLLPGDEDDEAILTHVVVAPGEGHQDVVVELLVLEQRSRQQRETRLFDQVQANKALIRQLAHEIKNPLGGIRGAAQLLQLELTTRELKDYTQVIIHEADRLQSLVDRLLAPHRKPHVAAPVNIHEVLERVRTLVLAEYPQGLKVVRDYDTSIPEVLGDKEQLIQVVLNVAQNAAQALSDERARACAEISFKTRVARQVTLGGVRHKLALELHVIDNGPGIPEAMRDRVFYPLVSGREGGTGLGLTLAQTFVQQHQGLIECSSQPGRTDFRILIPLV